MLRLWVVPLVLLGFSSAIRAEQGDDSAFFQQRSQHAFNAIFGLPIVAPRLSQTLEWHVSLEHSNQFAGGIEGDERLLMDGESTRLMFSYRQRLGSCWQLEATVPLVSHSEGRFDEFIDRWHKLFGLPDAERDTQGFNSLRYEYYDAQGIRRRIARPQSGLGDIHVGLQYALGCFATADSTGADPMVRVGMKLPTGDSKDLLGSGAADFYADWQSPVLKLRNKVHGGFAAGLLVNGQSEYFTNQQTIALYGSIGVQYALTHKLRIIAQMDGHSPFYKSGLRELGDPAVNMSVGGRYLYGSAYSYELSISEDVAIDTTPDIIARLSMTYRPDQTR